MNSSQESGSGRGKGGLWAILRRPSARYSMLSLLVVGIFAGIVLWGGFHTGMEATNSLEFCVSCHEMEQTVYQEYRKSVHYSNRTGVRAVCSDCHVPREWQYKVMRKVQASQEIWGKLTGSIDTKEKFEAKRLQLAENEWARMKASDSRECRNCHSFTGMNLDKQRDRSRKQHEIALQQSKTCIDCHKGIAHQKPKGMKGDEDDDV